MHGGNSPKTRDAADRRHAEMLTMQRRAQFRIEPVSEDDPEADIVEGAAMEYRRTLAWIRFCERQINALETDRELIFGLASTSTSTEHTRESQTGTSAGEDTDVDVERTVTRTVERFDGKINEWVKILNWNREHLDRQISRWLQHGLDVRRLALEDTMVEGMADLIGYVVRELGRDPADPAVRAIIRDAFDHLDFGRAAERINAPAARKPKVIEG